MNIPIPCPFCGLYPNPTNDSTVVEHCCEVLGMTFKVKCSTWNIRRSPTKTKLKKRFEADQLEMRLPTVRTPKQIENDLLLCALYSEEIGQPVTTVVGNDAKRMAVALKVIKAYCPDVKPAEIRRRSALYRARWPNVEFTANALSKWWNKMDAPVPVPRGPVTQADRIAANRNQQQTEISKMHRQFGMP